MVRPLDQCDDRPAGLNRQQRKKGASPPTLASILTMLCARQPFRRSCSCPRQTAACYYAPDLLFSRLSIAALRQRPYFKTHSCNLVWSNHSPWTAIFVSFMAAAIWTTVHSMLILCTSTHFNFLPARGGVVKDVLFRHEEPKPSVQSLNFKLYTFLCFLHSSPSSRRVVRVATLDGL